MPGLPRSPISRAPLGVGNIAGALAGLRFARVILGFDFRPSIGILARDVDRLGMDIRSFREPLTRAIRQVMMPSFKENFAVGGRPTWEPLAPYTVLRRGEAGPILVRSGSLAKTASSFGIWKVTPIAASIQDWPSRVWYGKLHQAGYGSAAGSSIEKQTSKDAAAVRIPARPFILFQDEDIKEIELIFFQWLGERARAVGRFQ